jgi:hypothetical protein
MAGLVPALHGFLAGIRDGMSFTDVIPRLDRRIGWGRA